MKQENLVLSNVLIKVEITDHFTCIFANVIYCKTCTLCKKNYIGEIGRGLADRFREHLQDVERNDTDATKPVASNFNLPNNSHHNVTICGQSLHHENTESRKNLEQKFIFQLGTLYPHGINERVSFKFHSFIHKLMLPYFHQWQSSSTPS